MDLTNSRYIPIRYQQICLEMRCALSEVEVIILYIVHNLLTQTQYHGIVRRKEGDTLSRWSEGVKRYRAELRK